MVSLLIAVSVLGTAIGALPGYSIAGHAPLIFIHTYLADGETAPAGPAEGSLFFAAVTFPVPGAAAFFAITGFTGRVSHFLPLSKPLIRIDITTSMHC